MKKILLSMCIALVGCMTNPDDFRKGKRQLENQGYTQVKSTGFDAWCCDEKDTYSEGFSCLDKNGIVTTGCICSSPFKGVTIRFQ